METLTDPGVGLEATADSQLPPPVVAATAVKVTPALPVTVTVPLYVPATNPFVFTPTVTVPGMVPGLAGVAVSHEPPEDVATAALKVTPAVPVTLMDCVDGAVAPMV